MKRKIELIKTLGDFYLYFYENGEIVYLNYWIAISNEELASFLDKGDLPSLKSLKPY